MKIAQVNLQRDWGGAERHVSLLSQGLRDAGEEVVVCCHPRGGLLRDILRNRLDSRPVASRNQLDLPAAVRLAAALNRFRPDIIHVHTPKDYAAGYLAARLLRNSVLTLTRHMVLPLKPVMRRIYCSTGAVFCLSAGIKAHLEAEGVPARLLRRVRSGIDIRLLGGEQARRNRAEVRQAWNLAPDDLAFGTVGRLVTGKGHLCLLMAARLVKESPDPAGSVIRLVFIGDGPERARLEHEARKLDLCGRVCFAGFVEDIPSALAALDCFVLPSEGELLPLSVMEAMAAGLPTIATNVGGMSELVEPEVTGILIPPNDPATLASALLGVAKDTALRENMGMKGRLRAEAEFSLAGMVRDTRAVYEDIRGKALPSPGMR